MAGNGRRKLTPSETYLSNRRNIRKEAERIYKLAFEEAWDLNEISNAFNRGYQSCLRCRKAAQVIREAQEAK